MEREEGWIAAGNGGGKSKAAKWERRNWGASRKHDLDETYLPHSLEVQCEWECAWWRPANWSSHFDSRCFSTQQPWSWATRPSNYVEFFCQTWETTFIQARHYFRRLCSSSSRQVIIKNRLNKQIKRKQNAPAGSVGRKGLDDTTQGVPNEVTLAVFLNSGHTRAASSHVGVLLFFFFFPSPDWEATLAAAMLHKTRRCTN